MTALKWKNRKTYNSIEYHRFSEEDKRVCITSGGCGDGTVSIIMVRTKLRIPKSSLALKR